MNLINNKALFATAAATLTLGAQANTLTGYIWENDYAGAYNATLANVPALNTASAKFSAPSGPL